MTRATTTKAGANWLAFELQPVVPRSWFASLHPPLLFAALTGRSGAGRAARAS